MKYPNIIFLLYCFEIMAGHFLDAQTLFPDYGPTDAPTSIQSTQDPLTTNSPFLELTPTNRPITDKQTSASKPNVKHTTSPPPPPQTTSTTLRSRIFRKECFLLVLVAGGLIIACAILLISTFLLACKVCQLSRRIKMLSSNSDLIGTAEYWPATAKKNENNSETEAKETTVLMSDLGQTCDEVGDGSKDEKGNMDGHKEKGVSENGGEVGDTAKTEENTKETPATTAENSSTSKPPKEVGDSQSTKAEGVEEAKDEA